MSDRVRREVRELVDGFGPPAPGLAARAAAGLPDRPPARSGARWAMAAAALLAVATAGLLLWAARGAPAPVPAGRPTPTIEVTSTPSPAPTPTGAAAVRAAVTGARPVLLPTAVVGADWWVRTQTTSDSFTVTYTSGDRTVTVGEGRENAPNPALPVAGTVGTHPSFHGDARSYYQINSGADPRSPRVLLWHEPGTYDHTDPSYPGVPYFVSSTGLTEAEFQQLIASLR